MIGVTYQDILNCFFNIEALGFLNRYRKTIPGTWPSDAEVFAACINILYQRTCNAEGIGRWDFSEGYPRPCLFFLFRLDSALLNSTTAVLGRCQSQDWRKGPPRNDYCVGTSSQTFTLLARNCKLQLFSATSRANWSGALHALWCLMSLKTGVLSFGKNNVEKNYYG